MIEIAECDYDVHEISNCKTQDIRCKHVPGKQLIYSMNSSLKRLINAFLLIWWFLCHSMAPEKSYWYEIFEEGYNLNIYNLAKVFEHS